MLMLTKTHAAVVAAKDAKITRLQQHMDRMAKNMFADDQRIAHLEARLAVFTAPRARDAKGHFISAKGASAC